MVLQTTVVRRPPSLPRDTQSAPTLQSADPAPLDGAPGCGLGFPRPCSNPLQHPKPVLRALPLEAAGQAAGTHDCPAGAKGLRLRRMKKQCQKRKWQFTAQCCRWATHFSVRPRDSGTILPIRLAACPRQQAPSPRAHLLITLRAAEAPSGQPLLRARSRWAHPPAVCGPRRGRNVLDTSFHLGHRRSATRTTLKPAPVTPNSPPQVDRTASEQSPPSGGWGLLCLPSQPPGPHWSQPVSPPEGGVTLTSLGDLKPAGSSSASDPAKHSTQGNWA